MKINKILKTSQVNDIVQVSGWVTTCRKQKNMSFIKCNDGSCSDGIQLIWENIDDDKLSLIQTGCSISVTGKLVESPAKGQSLEVQVIDIEIIGQVNPEE